MTTENKPTHVYIARKACGCCIGVCTDYQDKNTGEAVGEWIADGLTISRADWNTYKTAICQEPTFMSCPHGQMILPIIEGVDRTTEKA